MNDLLDEMEADMEAASEFNDVTTDGLKTVSSLAQEVSNWEGKVAELEEQLKTAKAKLLELTDRDLPDLMAEVGITNFTLADGSKLEVKQT